MPHSKITGLGFYVPEQVVTNADLAAQMDTSDEWIVERTGIRERRFFKEGVDTVSSMGARAARIAMERAGKKPEDIDMVVFATLSPDYHFPGCGVLVQRELGLRHTMLRREAAVCRIHLRTVFSRSVYQDGFLKNDPRDRR
jgi:3-oxoacyl-[acyl-carrier-protein] synthase-3